MNIRIMAVLAALLVVGSSASAQLENQVAYAKKWHMDDIRGCGFMPECSGYMRGDANCSGGYPDIPTIGDISAMVDAKFISNTCGPKPGHIEPIICNLDEADVNNSSGAQPGAIICDDITIGDISMLIDYLFITGPMNWDMGYGFFPSGEGKLPPCP